MKSPRGKIETNEKNNQAIITIRRQDKKIGAALQEIDQETQVKSYKLLYSKAKDVETKLLQIVPKEKGIST